MPSCATLSERSERLWAAYLSAERGQLRAVRQRALDEFLDALLAEPPALWKAWAKSFAREVTDDGAGWPVRVPLFRRALVPALLEGITAREPGPARWLASFDLQLLARASGEIPEPFRTPRGLLREALRADPHDQRARQKFVESVAPYLEYTLHELPAGVLWEQDGATPEQCEELQALLTDFDESVEKLRETHAYRDLIADCRLHFREYLLAGQPGGSYGAYLQDSSTRG
jgi:hypothetical protein